MQIKEISIFEKEYPKCLKNIYNPPMKLYVAGDYNLLSNFKIAIIGCRNCTEYGRKCATKFASELTQKNVIVVSGLARGVDSFAHSACINSGGKTIAVIGSGLDVIYPKENMWLYKKIIDTGGAIISEYPLGTKPLQYNFPARNRIISAISDGVLVVEAKEKSGTLITVDFALEQGKNVFVIPGNIDSKNSRGTNNLIKEGAKPVNNLEDILEEYHNYTKYGTERCLQNNSSFNLKMP